MKMKDQIGPSGLPLAALLLLLHALTLAVGPAGSHRVLATQPDDNISVDPSQHSLGHRHRHQHQHQHQQRHNSHHHLQRHKLRHRSVTSSQQVPEQLPPIVVSSSDNSYVSASPFESTTTTTSTTTPSPLLSPRPPASSNPTRKRFHLRRNKLFSSSNHELKDDLKSALDVSSDILTTATTTQRTDRLVHPSSRPQTLALDLGKELDQDNDEDEEYEDDDDDDNEQDHEDEEEEEEQVVSGGARSSGDGQEERVLPKKSHSAMGSRFNVKPATIIKTRESIRMGATLINYTLVTNLNACLVECWITDSCDTAIYQETPVDFNNHLPPSPFKQRNRNQIQTYLSSFLTRMSSSASPSTSLVEDNADEDDNEKDFRGVREIDSEEEEEKEEEEEDGDDDADDDDDKDVNDDEASKSSETLGREKRKRPAKLGFFVCYLFQCAKPDGFKCQFSAHNYYTSTLKATMPPHRSIPRPPTTTTTTTTTSPEDEQVQFNQIRPVHREQREPHYAQIISQRLEMPPNQPSDGNWFKSKLGLRPTPTRRLDPVHHASISIEQEDYNQYATSAGLNGAIVAILVGIGATGMIIVVVGHKMKSIRQRIAYKASRANKRTGPLLPPDTDYLITTMPMAQPVRCDGVPEPGRGT